MKLYSHALKSTALLIALCSCHDKDAEQALPSAATAAAVIPAANLAVATPEPVKKAPPRRFLEVQGTVTLDDKPATEGMEISETARIQTEADGKAVFTLVPGSVIALRPKTSLRLGASQRKKISVQLLAGAVWSFMPTASSYEVVTNNAVAGVRGTIFYVETTQMNATYVCACDGKVSVQSGGTNALPRDLDSHHQHLGTRIYGTKKKVHTMKAPLKNHDEAEADALIAEIAETQP